MTDWRKMFSGGRAAIFAAMFSCLSGSAVANPHFGSFDSLDTLRLQGFSRAPGGVCAIAQWRNADSATVISATKVAAVAGTPGYCAVRGVVGSATQFIIYLPDRWSGRIYMHGNGGFAGEELDAPLGHRARVKAVRQGFVAVFTDTGHEATAAPDGRWALNDLGREVDFGSRAVHQTIRAAKSISKVYYGSDPTRSYFDGCSTGGRQGLIAAQRYPDDFDGILAGAPVMDMSRMLWKYWSNQLAVVEKPLTENTLKRLADFIFERYDGLDGLKDGVISDPDAIDFDPRRDLPRKTPTSSGFTEEEIEALAVVYGPLTIDGVDHFPGQPVGSELPGLLYSPETQAPLTPQSPWLTRVVPDARGVLGQRGLVETWFRFMAFTPDDPQLDWRTLNLQRDFGRVARAAQLMNSTDPDLSQFADRGGKVLLYHGWADFGVNPRRSIRYHGEVSKLLGKRTDDVMRMYVIPGMFHCEGGLDVDRVDFLTPLIQWVESGRPPETLRGTRVESGVLVRERPICRYPARLTYAGSGDGARAEHFRCVVP